jgi:hypothetical protein
VGHRPGPGRGTLVLPAGLVLLAAATIPQTQRYGQPGAVPASGNSEINRDRFVATAVGAIRSRPLDRPRPDVAGSI